MYKLWVKVYEGELNWDINYFESGEVGVVVGDVVFRLIIEVENISYVFYFVFYVREIVCFS